ncbi:PREDICTED: uncharacterized protein LOC109334017 [Lupinus angustifolius]|uniref:uncharacterized protein LOC109334017 n=1 Tax=Lupinus angustifolius TaxID=3871 RepID=UPI00092E2245|nr:PREDICTED: uncharacterized protein LOC109334017 [Lupinus angustifolius]
MIAREDVNNMFWDELNLKFFAYNERGTLLPNLWGLCNKDLSPQVIATSNQLIAVSVTMEAKLVHLCAVYAHSHYIQRRALWKDIISLMRQHVGAWNCIGDFNVVRGAYECRGSRLPCSNISKEFISFSEEGNLVHLETRGAEFTWSNKRRGSALTEKRLDRSMCNDDWLSTWNSVSCCTLPKISSDHHPLLLTCCLSISKRTSSFRFLKMWMNHPDCSRVIEEAWNDSIVGCPMFIVSEKLKRLKAKLKSWNWNVFGNIHQNVQNSMTNVENIQACINSYGPSDDLLDQEGNAQLNLLKALNMENDFWKEKSRINWHMNGWLLPNMNSNSVILIPKSPNADKIEDFRPIALANFQFKIITKVLADRLSLIASRIISPQQKGFIRDRNIADCICTASEAINLLDHKCFGGNLAIKIDVRKAFDTMDWNFLLQTLHAFGFHDQFIQWINIILQSARLSINVNGQSVGFFKCSRGVRQGDPLSPLLFCFAEDVLSRGISMLVISNKLSSISGPNGLTTPSHVLYADDILIFCKGTKRELLQLRNLLDDYAQASGQFINPNKCKFYSNATPRKSARLSSYLGFNAGSLPFTYLGVPLFKGKPRKIFLLPIADRILNKLAKWKGHSLSIMGRVELIKSVILSMLVFSFHVYSWPYQLIKKLDSCIRNFIWSGDINTRKMVTVSWSQVCSTSKVGGLGIRSLLKLNKAALTKLAWELRHSKRDWAVLCRSRFRIHSNTIPSYLKSSIWPGIRMNWHAVNENAVWIIGKGDTINFWKDNWLGTPLVDLLNIPQHWQGQLKDLLCWKNSSDGVLTLKEAYNSLDSNSNPITWFMKIWSREIPPSHSFVTWRLLHNKMPSDDSLQSRGYNMVSMCSLCSKQAETSSHLFFTCPLATQIWNWIKGIFNIHLDFSSAKAILLASKADWCDQVHHLFTACIIHAISTIWWCRNQCRFHNKDYSIGSVINRIITTTSLSASYSKVSSKPSLIDLCILKDFKVAINYPKAPSILEVIWQPPTRNTIKVNTDGAARGYPGHAGGGAIFRDHSGQCIACMADYYGV